MQINGVASYLIVVFFLLNLIKMTIILSNVIYI